MPGDEMGLHVTSKKLTPCPIYMLVKVPHDLKIYIYIFSELFVYALYMCTKSCQIAVVFSNKGYLWSLLRISAV